MKKVLVTLVLVMTLGVSVSFAQAAPVEVPVVEKPQQSKKLVFSEIYMNDLPEAVMDRLALEGAMIKQAFMTYGIDGSRIYKINVLTSDAHEQTLFLGEDDSSLYNQVMQALETNENIRYEDGKWAFVQYDVMEYITRLEKAKRLLEKSKN